MSKDHIAAPSTDAQTHPTLPRHVFSHFARQSLARNRTRTVVSIIGIALSCALITAIFTSVATLMQGLLDATIQRNGTWQIGIENIATEALADLKANESVTSLYEHVNYGSALLPEQHECGPNRYLTVEAWPTDEEVHGLLPLPKLAEGRAPSAADEIVLPSSLKGMREADAPWNGSSKLTATGKDDDAPRATWEGGLSLDSTLKLALGERLWLDIENNREHACLASETLYTDWLAENDSLLIEWLGNIDEERTYRVVGFYDEDGTWTSMSGYLGLVAPDTPLPVRSIEVYASTAYSSRADIDQLVVDCTEHVSQPQTGVVKDSGAVWNETLLRYQLLNDDRAIWGTLYSLAYILSAIVMIAAVSLIYNSFAISVSERTRQYGLLSSLGASRHQIRRTVFSEALMLAGIGIPLGLLIGLAGTFTVFQIAGEGIGMLIDTEVYTADHAFGIVVSPGILGVSALLALITVAISAAVPAFCASRVSAVEAIRQTRDVNVSRKESRRQRCMQSHGTRPSKPRALDGIRMHLLGVPGWLAHRNLTRARSKGRVAVASLAVSVALLIASGSISHYMGYLVDLADDSACDILLSASIAPSGTDAPNAFLASVNTAYQDLSEVEGVTPRGYVCEVELYSKGEPGVFSLSDINSETAIAMSDVPEALATDDGSVCARTALLFVDDASWMDLVKENNLDKEAYCDPDHPMGVGVNNMPVYGSEKYGSRNPFEGSGSLELYTHIAAGDEGYFSGISLQDDAIVALYQHPIHSEDETPETAYRPLEDVVLDSYELPIGMILPNAPSCLGDRNFPWPTVVLPASALPALAQGSEHEVTGEFDTTLGSPFVFTNGTEYYTSSVLYVSFSFDAKDDRSSERNMSEMISKCVEDGSWGKGWERIALLNNSEDARSAALAFETIQLFIGCFAIITGAIAIANVFNTLTSSIILRRREFAMLKSAGMGNRAFRKMIALECASYAWRGLAGGLVLGGVATYFIWQAMSPSFYEIGYELPLIWVVSSFCLVIGVLGLSTVYALYKSNSGLMVQTLREDAI